MTTREFVLLALLLLAILGGVLDRQLAMRLEWVQFGQTYQRQQQDIINAVNRLGQEVQQIKSREDGQ